MRRFILTLVLVLLALVWVAPVTAAVQPDPSIGVITYTYVGAVYHATENYTAPERGPPLRANNDAGSPDDAVDLRSDGTSARSDGPTTSSTITYTRSTTPARAARATTTTGTQVVLADGHRLSLPRLQVAANAGSEVLLDTSAVVARGSARGLMKPGECAVICSTVARESAEHGFSTAGLSIVDDGVSATLRGQVAQQLRAFGARAQGFENDAVIGATAIERGVPLITGDWALANAVAKLGGEARWFAPGM